MIDDTLYDAFGQRQIAQYFTQLSSYYVIMEVLPSLQGDPATLDKIFLRSPTTGGEVPLSAFAKWTTTPIQPLSISHQGQFPAITISFNLAPGRGARPGDRRDRARQDRAEPPGDRSPRASRATPRPSRIRCRSVPLLILAALVVVYLILGILYESYIHPITILSTLPSAGVGALATLMLFHFDFSLIALIGIILLIGIVKKNGIMMVDFAIVAERDDHLSAARRHPPRGAAALPPDHDDHHGGDARRRAADAGPRHRLGDQAAARLRHGRRAAGEPGADLVHDAGRLSLSRPAVELADGRRSGRAEGRAPGKEGLEPQPLAAE